MTREDRAALIERHMPLAARIAHRVARRRLLPRHVGRDELVSAAYLGLVKAVDAFDPGRNVRLATYLDRRVRGEVLDWLRARDHLSRNQRRAGGPRLCQMPLVRCRHDGQRRGRLAAAEWRDWEPADPRPDPGAADRPVWESLAPLRAGLTWRERVLLVLRFREGWLLPDIGAVLGVCESRAWQMLAGAVEHMRHSAALRGAD